MKSLLDRSRDARLLQGILLLAGALALILLVSTGALDFFWTPLILGLAYLAAAAAGGRKGGYWATACVLTGWGLAVVVIGEARPEDIDVSGSYLLGAGLGATVGALLARSGFGVSIVGLGATVAAAGLVLALTPAASDLLEEERTYALLLGVVGLVNVALGALGKGDEATT